MLLFCTLLNVHQRNSLGEETVSVAAGFSEQCSVAPPEDLYKSWMEGRSALIILSAVLIIRCSLDLSCFVDEPNHTEMDEDRTD
ncbi:hypothetical protein AMECASPLE_028750 [Ameca splendens]|uniref:Uncharacterized protein n=1 Tax=Ameca splendens TaxID=208324 RepID=A0ABV1AF46_9TELE